MRAGDRRKTYDAERLDDISSRRQPDRFVLQMMATMILAVVVVEMFCTARLKMIGDDISCCSRRQPDRFVLQIMATIILAVVVELFRIICSFLFPVTKLVSSWNVSRWQIWVAERNIRFLLYFCKVLCHHLHK